MNNFTKIRMMPKEDLINFMVDNNVTIDGQGDPKAIRSWLESGGDVRRQSKFKEPKEFPYAKALLKSKYGSVNKAAIALNLQLSNLYCMLNGKMTPFPKYMKIISDDLGMDENELFPVEEEEK